MWGISNQTELIHSSFVHSQQQFTECLLWIKYSTLGSMKNENGIDPAFIGHILKWTRSWRKKYILIIIIRGCAK